MCTTRKEDKNGNSVVICIKQSKDAPYRLNEIGRANVRKDRVFQDAWLEHLEKKHPGLKYYEVCFEGTPICGRFYDR